MVYININGIEYKKRSISAAEKLVETKKTEHKGVFCYTIEDTTGYYHSGTEMIK